MAKFFQTFPPDKTGYILLCGDGVAPEVILYTPNDENCLSIMSEYESWIYVDDLFSLGARIAILKEISLDYKGKTIDNIIQQMESRAKELEKGGRL